MLFTSFTVNKVVQRVTWEGPSPAYHPSKRPKQIPVTCHMDGEVHLDLGFLSLLLRDHG